LDRALFCISSLPSALRPSFVIFVKKDALFSFILILNIQTAGYLWKKQEEKYDIVK